MSRRAEQDVADLVARARDGESRAVARLVSMVEDGSPQLREVMAALTPHTGHAHVVGITGPVGSFLADHLLTIPGLDIHVFKRWRSDPRPIAQLRGRVTFHEGDIEDPFAVDRAVAEARPERVFHLAAQSYPSASWDAAATMPIRSWGRAGCLAA